MKKLWILLLALVMVLGLTACGGGEEPVQAEPQEVESEDPVVEEPEEDTSDQDDLSSWSCYMGVMDDETTVYYAYHPEGTRAAFIALSPDYTESVSVIGDYVFDEESGIGYITDDATGLTIGDYTTDNGDGTYSVDLGNLGSAVIAEADPAEVLNAMDTIQAETTDITADFIAMLEGGEAESAEGSVEFLEIPVVITNNTGVDIYELYATSANLENWGDDILGGNYLPDGVSIETVFNIGVDDLQWDMKMVDSEGTEISLMGLDFSECSVEGGTIMLEFDGESGYATLYSN